METFCTVLRKRQSSLVVFMTITNNDAAWKSCFPFCGVNVDIDVQFVNEAYLYP